MSFTRAEYARAFLGAIALTFLGWLGASLYVLALS